MPKSKKDKDKPAKKNVQKNKQKQTTIVKINIGGQRKKRTARARAGRRPDPPPAPQFAPVIYMPNNYAPSFSAPNVPAPSFTPSNPLPVPVSVPAQNATSAFEERGTSTIDTGSVWDMPTYSAPDWELDRAPKPVPEPLPEWGEPEPEPVRFPEPEPTPLPEFEPVWGPDPVPAAFEEAPASTVSFTDAFQTPVANAVFAEPAELAVAKTKKPDARRVENISVILKAYPDLEYDKLLTTPNKKVNYLRKLAEAGYDDYRGDLFYKSHNQLKTIYDNFTKRKQMNAAPGPPPTDPQPLETGFVEKQRMKFQTPPSTPAPSVRQPKVRSRPKTNVVAKSTPNGN